MKKDSSCKLIIRRYTQADQAAVESLHVSAIRAAGAYLGRGPWDDDIYAIEEHYLNADGEFLIGEIEGRLVAMGAFRRTSPARAEIMRMRVHPNYQGQGLGVCILNELETRALASGYTTLHLHTSTVQISARKLYEKNGFREVGREAYHGFQIILYEKALGVA
jgi:GNAT superfamily N-acetyltransferase